MQNALKFIVATIVAIMLMMVVRSYAFTLYTVSDDGLQPTFRKGQRVLVNKLARSSIGVGDFVVFSQEGAASLGRIGAAPGDTITVGSEDYLIPTYCRKGCKCGDCALFLVEANGSQLLVAQGDIVGKAWRRSTK